MITLAAAADLHYGMDSGGKLAQAFAEISERADIFLIAGDLTQHGLADEAAVLADDLQAVEVPVVMVLGNHDHHGDQNEKIGVHMEKVGVTVLDGSHISVDIDGTKLGIAGTKGFGGGFLGACGTEFGEPEMKAFIRHTSDIATGLARALKATEDAAHRVALLHYSPVEETLQGERLEIFPFLGSYLLGEAIDTQGADLVIHGHAHFGSEEGTTPGGTPVRNVSIPVIGRPYVLYRLGEEDRDGEEAGEL